MPTSGFRARRNATRGGLPLSNALRGCRHGLSSCRRFSACPDRVRRNGFAAFVATLCPRPPTPGPERFSMRTRSAANDAAPRDTGSDHHLLRGGIDDVLRRFPGHVDPALPAGDGRVRHRRQLEIERLPVGIGHQVRSLIGPPQLLHACLPSGTQRSRFNRSADFRTRRFGNPEPGDI